MVGTKVEHGGLLDASMRFLQAWELCGAPKLTVIVSQGFRDGFLQHGWNCGWVRTCSFPGLVPRSDLWIRRLRRMSSGPMLTQPITALTGWPETMLIDEVIDPPDTAVVLADALPG